MNDLSPSEIRYENIGFMSVYRAYHVQNVCVCVCFLFTQYTIYIYIVQIQCLDIFTISHVIFSTYVECMYIVFKQHTDACENDILFMAIMIVSWL